MPTRPAVTSLHRVWKPVWPAPMAGAWPGIAVPATDSKTALTASGKSAEARGPSHALPNPNASRTRRKHHGCKESSTKDQKSAEGCNDHTQRRREAELLAFQKAAHLPHRYKTVEEFHLAELKHHEEYAKKKAAEEAEELAKRQEERAKEKREMATHQLRQACGYLADLGELAKTLESQEGSIDPESAGHLIAISADDIGKRIEQSLDIRAPAEQAAK